jgi:hypothetical protein
MSSLRLNFAESPAANGGGPTKKPNHRLCRRLKEVLLEHYWVWGSEQSEAASADLKAAIRRVQVEFSLRPKPRPHLITGRGKGNR